MSDTTPSFHPTNTPDESPGQTAPGPTRALQLATQAAVSERVAGTVVDILAGNLTLTEAFTLAVESLAQTPGVDRVAAVSTGLQP